MENNLEIDKCHPQLNNSKTIPFLILPNKTVIVWVSIDQQLQQHISLKITEYKYIWQCLQTQFVKWHILVSENSWPIVLIPSNPIQ